jgi:glycine/D-amino acid oxidase-like deaminating enzyme
MTMSAAGANDSVWYHTATARPPIPRSRGAVRADVAVVGGGLTGLAAALHLLEKGAQVVVVEAEEIGSGASGRNGGFVVPHFARGEPDDVIRNLGEGGERLVRLVGNSAQALFELVARHGIECDAAQQGWYQAAHSAAAWRRLERRAAQWACHGQSVGVHDAAATSRLTGTHGYFGSWSNLSGGTVHPLKLVHGLAAAVLARRGEIREKCGVERLTRTANGWQLATVDGEVSAPEVLVCTNALSWTLVPALASAVTPATIIQVATEPIPPPARAHLLGAGQGFSDTRINLFTYRFDAEWRLITGALPSWLRGDRRLRSYLVARLQNMLSLPAAPKIDYLWSGRASVGPNFLPAIYAVDKGVHASAGCNGRGVAMALEMGRVLAESVVSGRWHEAPIPYRELRGMKGSRWKQWGVRWYPVYGAVKDRLEQFVGS